MKIKFILLLTVIGSIVTAQANPFNLIRDIVVAVDSNIGPGAVLGHCNNRSPIITPYYSQQRSSHCYQQQRSSYYRNQEDTFHKPVIHVRDGVVSRGAPPPDAYKYVRYPGPAPKHLYNDKSISVHNRGDEHYVIYRKPGW